ncbi:MAG: hypothetical protein K9L61_04030 [Candidatus Omnitrophica bacterium]|nr:hypothetical protein [Candidatus Omnitrophota bacterium]
MRKKNFKIIGLILLSFLIDVVRPLDYNLLVNATFLMLIVLSFYNKLAPMIWIAFLAGFTQDALIFPSRLFYAIEYPLIVLATFSLNNILKFIKMRNHPLISKAIIAALLISIHSFLSILIANANNFFFLINFFVQSYLVFFLINYLIEKTFKKYES